MNRVYNFAAGPACLPLPVLEQARDEFISYQNSGMSVMEMTHRGKHFEAIIHEAEELLRELLDIPANYKVLFLQGGAVMQFSMLPLNLMRASRKADYFITGEFAEKAAKEAAKFGTVNIAASSEDRKFAYIPKTWTLDPDADYAHINLNNTIFGTRFTQIPDTGAVPLAADASSCILSEPLDVKRFGLIYAGAQKNIGPAGLTVVIMREDLIGFAGPKTPVMLDYKTFAENESMYNTPPTFAIYMAMLVFRWLKSLGGLTVMQKMNQEKAKLLYDCLDASSLFKPTADKEDRSLMNVTFTLPTEDLTAAFLKAAEAQQLANLKGHRKVGGFRASLYNAMPIEGVRKLVAAMQQFERENHV